MPLRAHATQEEKQLARGCDAKLHPEERCESSNAARAGTPLTQETQRVKAQRTEEWVRAGQPWELPVTGQKAEREYTEQRQARAGGNPALPEQG